MGSGSSTERLADELNGLDWEPIAYSLYVQEIQKWDDNRISLGSSTATVASKSSPRLLGDRAFPPDPPKVIAPTCSPKGSSQALSCLPCDKQLS